MSNYNNLVIDPTTGQIMNQQMPNQMVHTTLVGASVRPDDVSNSNPAGLKYEAKRQMSLVTLPKTASALANSLPDGHHFKEVLRQFEGLLANAERSFQYDMNPNNMYAGQPTAQLPADLFFNLWSTYKNIEDGFMNGVTIQIAQLGSILQRLFTTPGVIENLVGANWLSQEEGGLIAGLVTNQQMPLDYALMLEACQLEMSAYLIKAMSSETNITQRPEEMVMNLMDAINKNNHKPEIERDQLNILANYGVISHNMIPQLRNNFTDGSLSEKIKYLAVTNKMLWNPADYQYEPMVQAYLMYGEQALPNDGLQAMNNQQVVNNAPKNILGISPHFKGGAISFDANGQPIYGKDAINYVNALEGNYLQGIANINTGGTPVSNINANLIHPDTTLRQAMYQNNNINTNLIGGNNLAMNAYTNNINPVMGQQYGYNPQPTYPNAGVYNPVMNQPVMNQGNVQPGMMPTNQVYGGYQATPQPVYNPMVNQPNVYGGYPQVNFNNLGYNPPTNAVPVLSDVDRQVSDNAILNYVPNDYGQIDPTTNSRILRLDDPRTGSVELVTEGYYNYRRSVLLSQGAMQPGMMNPAYNVPRQPQQNAPLYSSSPYGNPVVDLPAGFNYNQTPVYGGGYNGLNSPDIMNADIPQQYPAYPIMGQPGMMNQNFIGQPTVATGLILGFM